MAELNEVNLPYRYYPDFEAGRPVANGKIYIGVPDTDPQVTANQIAVKATQESGATVTVPQPIRTSAGGVPTINGSPVQLVVDGEHSIKVLNSRDEQVYYAPLIVGGVRPTTIVRSQLIQSFTPRLPDRLINSVLFIPNITFEAFFAVFAPILDLGGAGNNAVTIENIPEYRIDLAQGDFVIDLED